MSLCCTHVNRTLNMVCAKVKRTPWQPDADRQLDNSIKKSLFRYLFEPLQTLNSHSIHYISSQYLFGTSLAYSLVWQTVRCEREQRFIEPYKTLFPSGIERRTTHSHWAHKTFFIFCIEDHCGGGSRRRRRHRLRHHHHHHNHRHHLYRHHSADNRHTLANHTNQL